MTRLGRLRTLLQRMLSTLLNWVGNARSEQARALHRELSRMRGENANVQQRQAEHASRVNDLSRRVETHRQVLRDTESVPNALEVGVSCACGTLEEAQLVLSGRTTAS
jgi:uncharacterized protein YlxW (UPF0749 family)